MKKAVVIGSGFAGLSASCFLAGAGWNVTVLEKNGQPGGRAAKFTAEGFTFDMGPSWYWMPDIFDRFFNAFDKTTADYYALKRLDPSYRIYTKNESIDIPADYAALRTLFEQREKGSGKKLDVYLEEAALKYRVGMQRMAYKPGLSVTELLDWRMIAQLGRLDLFTSVKTHVARFFKDPLLQQLMEFPVLFLGAQPSKIPALYSLMNYADIAGGTWYPEGGMHAIAAGMYSLACSLGVQFRFNSAAQQIKVTRGKAAAVATATNLFEADVVVGAADYHHIENGLLEKKHRVYTPAYWEKRKMAPGCLLYFVGLNKKIPGLSHHSLFFDAEFSLHSKEIYEKPAWPSDPLFYMSATSVTDATVAPAGCENLFLLIPVAPGLSDDSDAIREKYFNTLIARIEKKLGAEIMSSIVYKRSYAHADFLNDYNAYKGNAYGLANTLMQTAVLKPSCRSKKVVNLFYAGQLTVPGPGVPPCLVSGELVAKQIIQQFGN